MFNTFYKIEPSIGDYLVNNLKLPYNSKRFIKCDNPFCKVCPFANTSYILMNNKSLPILIPISSTCSSTNCIYIISCIKCKKFYIGETSRTISIRIKEHLSRIKKTMEIKDNQDYLDSFLKNNFSSSLLYKHFAFDHNISQDLRFQVFINNIVKFRLRLETDLMFIFNSIQPFGLNLAPSHKLNNLENYNFKL